MRRFTRFLFLLLTPWLLSAQSLPDRTQDHQVKTWRLTGNWTYVKHFQDVKVAGDVVTTRTYDGEVHARVQFKLVQAKTHSSKRYRWQLEKGFKPIAAAQIRIKDHTLMKPKVGQPQWSQMEITLDGNAQDGEARLDMEPGDGTYKLVASFMSRPGKTKATNSQGGKMESESPFSFSSGALDCEGTASGMTFSSYRPDGLVSAPLENPAGSFLNFQWQLAPWEMDPDHEATLDLVDHTWLPDPAKSVKVLVKWEGKAEKVRVYLENVSVEPGTCLNDEPKEGEETDLTVASQGDWAVTKEGKGAGTKYTAIRPLPKQDPPQQVELEIKATDYGAWGTVHADVLLDGKWKDATFNGKTSMEVPYDLDGNHIADPWEEEHGAKGKAADADDDEKPEGNGFKGDGLTNYEEYPGFHGRWEPLPDRPQDQGCLLLRRDGYRLGAWREQQPGEGRHRSVRGPDGTQGAQQADPRRAEQGPHREPQSQGRAPQSGPAWGTHPPRRSGHGCRGRRGFGRDRRWSTQDHGVCHLA